MRTNALLAVAAVSLACAAPLSAQQQRPHRAPAGTDTMVKAAFPTASADWQSRLEPDETMKLCSAWRNDPPKAVADEIQERARATIVYPSDGKFMGDWKKGEALAQSGYGMRFTDYPPRGANGGNCYACHQITKKEVSYGTLGPSLAEYGKLRDFKPEEVKKTYEKIYNSHAVLPCSNMPRFGANGVLSPDQIKDAVALLMSPDSPVNKGQ
jgi:sulfur-oxidizing protein SoxX